MPTVRMTDFKSDVADLTTYTFTACNIGPRGQNFGEPVAYGTVPHLRNVGCKAIFVVVHAEDAAITFAITSCSLGGVAGTEQVDRGGGTAAINTGIYVFYPKDLEGITNTDIVVVMSEAVTTCAVGVLIAENFGVINNTNSSASTATGAMSDTITGGLATYEFGALCIGGSTCATGGGTEKFASEAQESSTGTGHANHHVLYDFGNAEMDCAAFYTWMPAYPRDNVVFRVRSSWSGAGNGDQAIVAYV